MPHKHSADIRQFDVGHFREQSEAVAIGSLEDGERFGRIG
jgi:hypothetical protein